MPSKGYKKYIKTIGRKSARLQEDEWKAFNTPYAETGSFETTRTKATGRGLKTAAVTSEEMPTDKQRLLRRLRKAGKKARRR